MKDIQQLIKKNSQEGRYEDIFPKTFIDAVLDKESGVTLTDILAMFNMLFLSYNGSRSQTRLQVPSSLRREGLWITYVLYDKTVVTEWYSAEAIDDTTFGDSANWRDGSNALVGDISISSDGYWVINGEVTNIKAQGEAGITPILRVGSNNHLQVSYTNGSSYVDVSPDPVFTQFRVSNNKLEQSVDLGLTWTVASDYIAAWFRFTGTAGSSQADNVGKIQISRDNGATWSDLSGEFTNSLHIKGYVATVDALPSSAVQGDIYGVGPTYDTSDTEHTNPIYQLYVKNSTGWVNNGRFTSISAGVVQEMGDSETEVMSQKAVSTNLSDIRLKAEKVDYRNQIIFKRESPNLINLEALTPNKAISAYGVIYEVHTDKDYMTEYIHVYKDVPYILSGGYTNTTYSLFRNIGDINNPITYGKIKKEVPFIPTEEGYIVLQIRDSSIETETYTTAQFEEGDIPSSYKSYSPIVYRVVDDKYLPLEGVMREEDYIIEIADSYNLIDLDKAQYNTAISSIGNLYHTSSYNISSDWIPVKGGTTYYLSGGYALNQIVLFANYGSTSNPLAYDEINGFDGATYTPISDGYVVLEIADSSSAIPDRSSTIQFEEGSIASPYRKGGEKKKYLNKKYLEIENTNLISEYSIESFIKARIDFDSKTLIADENCLCTPKLVVPNSDYIYVSGLGSSDSERVCLFYDGDTVNYWKFRGYGSSFKIPINGACTHFILWFKAGGEYVSLENLYISGLPPTYKVGECTNTFKQVFKHKNEVSIPLDINNEIGQIIVQSDTDVNNALIPVHIHYSDKPRYAVDKFDHVYLGSNKSYLKEDISFLLNGEVLPSRRFGGNYTLVPTSNSRFLYFNAQFTHNGVSKIIGSYNGDNGVFIKEDINSEWEELISDAKFGFIDSNLDIYYKQGNKLYCANINNLDSPTLIYSSPSSSFFIDFDCFTETDDYVFFGTYQNEWDTKVYRINKSNKIVKICFDTTQKQHVHKIIAINNVIYLCCDGATANNANFDIYPTYLTKGMATFKSADFGDTWETIQFPWMADYGIVGYHNGWFYGSAEASIKYAPSLYRSKDLRNWEVVENVPATAGGSFRICDKGFIQSSMSAGFLTHNVIKYSEDGQSFIPIFDKRTVSSYISTGLKPTHNYNNSIVIDNNKCVLLNDQSQILKNGYIFNEIGYTVFAYIQANLKAGDNVIKICSGGCTKDITPIRNYAPLYNIQTLSDKILDSSLEGVAINSVGVPSNLTGFVIPYNIEAQHGIATNASIKENVNITLGTLAFSIKEFSYFEGKNYKLFDFGTLKIYRNKSKLIFEEYGKVAAECTLGSMGYYSNISARVHITFGDNINVYVNGKLNSTTTNTTDFPRGITRLSLSNENSNDFISNICFYASAMRENQVIADFEGFNII